MFKKLLLTAAICLLSLTTTHSSSFIDEPPEARFLVHEETGTVVFITPISKEIEQIRRKVRELQQGLDAFTNFEEGGLIERKKSLERCHMGKVPVPLPCFHLVQGEISYPLSKDVSFNILIYITSVKDINSLALVSRGCLNWADKRRFFKAPILSPYDSKLTRTLNGVTRPIPEKQQILTDEHLITLVEEATELGIWQTIRHLDLGNYYQNNPSGIQPLPNINNERKIGLASKSIVRAITPCRNLTSLTLCDRFRLGLAPKLEAEQARIHIKPENHPEIVEPYIKSITEFTNALGNLKYLSSLDLTSCQLYIGINIFSQALSKLKCLKNLGLGNNNILDPDMKTLAPAIGELHLLEELDLSWNREYESRALGIKDKGSRKLARQLTKLACLRKLSLGQNSIGDEGAIAIASALEQKTNLQKLDLSGNQITSKGASAAAPRFGNLRALEVILLHQNLIGDAGAEDIVRELAKIRRLKVVTLIGGNQIEDMTIMAPLKKLFPNLKTL